jgi:hypothetical protein
MFSCLWNGYVRGIAVQYEPGLSRNIVLDCDASAWGLGRVDLEAGCSTLYFSNLRSLLSSAGTDPLFQIYM